MRPTKILTILVLALSLAWGFAVSAQAILMEFDINAPSNGTGGYAGGSAPFVAANIGVSSFNVIEGTSGPYDGQTIYIIDGKLGFTTGTFMNMAYGTNGREYYFDTGGIFTITGAIPNAGITDPNTILYQAAFLHPDWSDSIELLPHLLSQYGLNEFIGYLSGYLNGDLNAYCGLSPTSTHYYGEIDLNSIGPYTLCGNVQTVATPVPPTALLLGSSLLALLGWRRFRKG
jgi:hypothetical protein